MKNIKYKAYGLIILISVFLVLAIYKADRIIINLHLADSQRQVSQDLNRIKSQLTFNLYSNILAVKGLSSLFIANPSISQQQFALAAQELVGKHNQIRNIAAAPNLIIKYMYPIEGNEAAIGLDFRTVPHQLEAITKAKDSRQVVLAGPLTLVQGGMALIARNPIFIKSAEGKEVFWGIASAVIDINLLYKKSGLLDFELPIEIAIRKKDAAGREENVFFGTPELFNQKNVTASITLPNSSWQIAARPSNGWTALPKNIWITRLTITGIAASLLLALFFFLRASVNASIANVKFKTLIEGSSVPYFIQNEKQEITFVNVAFVKFFGYIIEDIPTLNALMNTAFPDPVYREQVKSLWISQIQKTYASDDFIEPLEISFRCKDGSNRVVLANLAVNTQIINSDFPIILYDITDRKLAEQKLQLSARVFNDTHEGIMITDANKCIVDVNPAFCDISGYSLEEIIGQNPRLLSSGKHNSEFYAGMWRSINETGHWRGEVWNRKKNGELYAELVTISSLLNDQGKPTNYIAVFSDITQSKQQQEELRLMAHYDILTGLPNRTLFTDRFHQAIAHSKRSRLSLAICFIDLDNFKPINDNFGHDAGDQLLIEVARRITESIREEDTVSRQGGDEFALLLNDIESFEQCAITLERIIHTLEKPFLIHGKYMQIGASIGATLCPSDNEDIDTLLRHADNAMYIAKQSGKNRFHLFDTEHDKQVVQKNHRLTEIQHALGNNEFELYYQPKVNMVTGEVYGVEALIRWVHPEKGLIPPLDFLPLIDGNELEIQIGNWVINQALQQAKEWLSQGIQLEMSVNIASHHLQSEFFFTELEAALKRHPEVNPEKLQLEILESSVLGDVNIIGSIISTCQDILGIKVALDDFGTGYSSLTHLRNLRAGTIKIDQSFVRDMLNDPNDYAIIDGVMGLAKAFNRSVIAEGVETTEHGLMLILMDCTLAQGYGIAKPMPATEIAQWLSDYLPNKEWVESGKNSLTKKEKSLEILKLTVKYWMRSFTHNVLSPEGSIKNWPIMERDNNHWSKWLKHNQQEENFSSHYLVKFNAVYDDVLNVAQTILTHYIDEQYDLARNDLPLIQSAFEKMIDVAESSK